MPAPIIVSEATDSDMFRFYGKKLMNPWHGLVAKVGSRIVAFGGVYVNEAGEVVGFMDLRKGARRPVAYRYVSRFIADLMSRGCREITVSCDERFDRAAAFLDRLGFTPTDREEGGRKVWIKSAGLKVNEVS